MLTITSKFDKKTGATTIDGCGSPHDLAIMLGNIANAICTAMIDAGTKPAKARSCILEVVTACINDTPCDPPLTARERRLTDRIEEQSRRIETLYSANERIHKAYEDALDKRLAPQLVAEIMADIKEANHE